MSSSYIDHLIKDKRLGTILLDAKPISLNRNDNVCMDLCSSIMSQQLSVKVARVFHQRFINLLGTDDPHPSQITAISYEQLRSIGLSHAKANYVHNVARFAVEEGMEVKKLEKMDNESLIEFFMRIKGVGRWTAEMLLMFTLGREDVFAVDDLGIQQAMIRLYKLKPDDKKQMKIKMLKLSNKWAPYRTYACLHLWKWKDNVPATVTTA